MNRAVQNGSVLLDRMVAQSREFVCQRWGDHDAYVELYAPVTRWNGAFWIHATWARECPAAEIRARATRIWAISGSFWNPGVFRLLYRSPLS